MKRFLSLMIVGLIAMVIARITVVTPTQKGVTLALGMIWLLMTIQAAWQSIRTTQTDQLS